MLVSILINNYNYEAYLEDAIASALNQTYPSVEVVVVDDGSRDGSRQIIEKFGDRVVPVFKQNGGQASAINAGFQVCHGEVIFLLDADDCFKPNKVAKVIELFDKNPDSGWCFHELKEVDRDGQSIFERNRHKITHLEVVNLRSIFTEGKDFSHWFPATSGLGFRRKILNEILPIPEAFRVSADALIRLAAIYLSPGILSPETLATHRQHGKNLYEFRSDIHIERSKVGIKTAYFLSQLIPETRPFTNKKFIFHTGKLAEYSSLDQISSSPESELYIKREKGVAFQTKLAIYILKGYLKRLLKSS